MPPYSGAVTCIPVVGRSPSACPRPRPVPRPAGAAQAAAAARTNPISTATQSLQFRIMRFLFRSVIQCRPTPTLTVRLRFAGDHIARAAPSVTSSAWAAGGWTAGERPVGREVPPGEVTRPTTNRPVRQRRGQRTTQAPQKVAVAPGLTR